MTLLKQMVFVDISQGVTISMRKWRGTFWSNNRPYAALAMVLAAVLVLPARAGGGPENVLLVVNPHDEQAYRRLFGDGTDSYHQRGD